ncbi:transposase [Loigolactobacillus coryniformis]|uniref:transposase n=1 Tax=Loigolactobacillus coryniformis TaxID=1610 RepID=UPI0021E686C3
MPCTEVVVRGDSGFATPELYQTCAANGVFYLIRLKANRKLSQLAEDLIQIDDGQGWEKPETHYYATTYQANSWPVPRRIDIKSTRPAGELLFEHEYLVTNFTHLGAEAAFTLYRQRGEMENDIKVGFYFDKTDSSRFSANHARIILSVRAYNLVSFMKRLALPERHRGLQINTIRLWLFKIAGKLVHSGRKIQLKLSTYHVHQALFYQLLAKIQAIQWQGLAAQR